MGQIIIYVSTAQIAIYVCFLRKLIEHIPVDLSKGTHWLGEFEASREIFDNMIGTTTWGCGVALQRRRNTFSIIEAKWAVRYEETKEK